MKQLFRELKRRNVYKVAVTYALVAFVTLQAAQLVFPATTLEGLYDKLVVLAFVGFPIALVIAWAFELTPEGIQRTPTEGEGAAPSRRRKSRRAITALVALGLVGAAVAGGWYLMGGGGESPGAESEPRAGDRSIAVLPFENLSGTEEAEPFVHGIHDDLLARLSNVSDLEVISRTSVQRYRDTDLSLPAIADSLGVRWVMEGGVQELGDQIQVNAQLIDPRTDTHAWADSYRRDLTAEDLFELQSEITRRIARSLQAELSPGEETRLDRQPTGNLQAYRLYVRGQREFRERNAEGAEEKFREALARDSGYAPAWAGLAAVRASITYRDYLSRDSLLTEARTAVDRALELDPELAEAHASLGYLLMRRKEGPAALEALERALELKPSYAQAHHWLGRLEAALGRPRGALRHQRRSVELNPLAPDAQEELANAYLYNGEPEKALVQARRAREIEPGNYTSLVPTIAYLHTGRGEDAFDETWIARDQDTPIFLGVRVVTFLLQGDTTRARSLLERLGPGAIPLERALSHAALGQVDEAFAALEEVDWSELGDGRTATLRYSWPRHLGAVREDPRFQEILRQMNESWGLNPDGSLPEGVDVSLGSAADD